MCSVSFLVHSQSERTAFQGSSTGRITQDELLATLDAAAEVADLLERDDRWWSGWDDWAPSDGAG